MKIQRTVYHERENSQSVENYELHPCCKKGKLSFQKWQMLKGGRAYIVYKTYKHVESDPFTNIYYVMPLFEHVNSRK